MKTKILSIALLMTAASVASANTIELGKALPNVDIVAGGITSVSGDDVSFSKWSVSDLPTAGTTVIIASAARPAANEMTPADLIEYLETNSSIKLYKVVNSDDAPFGAGMFIEGAIKDGKLAKPQTEVVLDEDGDLFSEWELEEEGSLIVVLKRGKVVYSHEGIVGSAEKAKVMSLTN